MLTSLVKSIARRELFFIKLFFKAVLITALAFIGKVSASENITLAELARSPFEGLPTVRLSKYGDALHQETAHRLTLAPLKKINGEWISEREELLAGDLAQKSYELTSAYSLQTAWDVVQDYFTQKQAELVFECIGLACGSSNAWANERLRVKQLYGQDVSQHYQVWQLLVEQKQVFFRVYLVQRGNKRVYLQWDTLTTSEPRITPSTSVIAKRFYRDGKILLEGVVAQGENIVVDENVIKPFVIALNQQPFRRLYVSVISDDDKATKAHSVIESLGRYGIQVRRMEAVNITYVVDKVTEEDVPGRVWVQLSKPSN